MRVCVRQIVTEPIICHSYHPECSHEDINRKRSHFICKEKGRCFLKISKARIHTPRPHREGWGEQQGRYKGTERQDEQGDVPPRDFMARTVKCEQEPLVGLLTLLSLSSWQKIVPCSVVRTQVQTGFSLERIPPPLTSGPWDYPRRIIKGLRANSPLGLSSFCPLNSLGLQECLSI